MKKLLLSLLVAVLVLTSTALAASYEVTAQTYVGDFGQMVDTFTVAGLTEEEAAAVKAEDFVITHDVTHPFLGQEAAEDVLSVSYADGALVLDVEDFLYLSNDFVVSYTGEAPLNLSFTKAQLSSVSTLIADDFVAGEEGAVHYRLYVPADATEPLPLIVWTHGGGEGGDDNWIQLVANRGAIAWVETFKDVVVLAPQTNSNWSEEESAGIGEVIRQLIADGTVDPKRVYGSGCSAGGRGCIMTAYRNKELYTAIAPICPTMMDDSMKALINLGDMPVWISTAYQDHTPTRDEYIVAIVTAMNATGSESAQYTLYQREDFAPYGISVAAENFGEMHFSWVLTLNNANGIMDWLFAQSK